uniref:Nei like DNA glycosylase 2 n=1 Tax=Sphenodon punctatus TaxID=8508 RepID=A0A8D0HR85_SPHPU
MPEGPSVKKFQLLASPFVGQVVAKGGGSSRQINPNDLKALRRQDVQVHGKNLFLAFGAVRAAQSSGESPALGPIEGPSIQGKAASEGCSHTLVQEGKALDVSELQVDGEKHYLQEDQETYPSVSDAPRRTAPWKWLHLHFGLFGSVRANEFSRANKANQKGDWKDPVPRLVLHFDRGGFLVFYNCQIRWCSTPASDILCPEFHRNIIKNEIFSLSKIHPLCQGALLAPMGREALLEHAVQFSADWLTKKLQGTALHHHVYVKEKCPLGHEVMKGAFGPADGYKRFTWWCPQSSPAISTSKPPQSTQHHRGLHPLAAALWLAAVGPVDTGALFLKPAGGVSKIEGGE